MGVRNATVLHLSRRAGTELADDCSQVNVATGRPSEIALGPGDRVREAEGQLAAQIQMVCEFSRQSATKGDGTLSR